jgi:hypothetical protein
MVRRAKKKSRRKSPKTVSLWNLGVGWVYLTSFTKMATGTGPVSFLLGDGDLMPKSEIAVDPALQNTTQPGGRSFMGRYS